MSDIITKIHHEYRDFFMSNELSSGGKHIVIQDKLWAQLVMEHTELERAVGILESKLAAAEHYIEFMQTLEGS